VIIYFIILVLLTISGAIIFTCTNISLKLKFKYPKVKCDSINQDYGVDKTTFDIKDKDLARFTTDSIKEYTVNKKYEEKKEATHF